MRIKAHGSDTQKPIYLQKDRFYTMSNSFSSRRTTHTLKMNCRHVLLFHDNEIIPLTLFLYLFSKQNQNLLAVDRYKTKTTFV